MNVLYITRKFPPSIGGMQTQSAQLYESLARKNKVSLISWGHSQALLPIFVLYAFIRASIELLIKDIDVIQLGDIALSPLGLLLKYFFKRPVLTISHGRDSVYSAYIYDRLVLGAAQRLDRVICVSNGIRKRLEMRGFAGERLVVIPNGICTANSGENITDRRRPVQLLEERYDVSLKGKKIIISVSRLVPKKGIAEFVENISPKITAKCPQAVFFIAGHGPERSRVSNAISRFKFEDRVILAGELKHGGPELKALFGAADVFVMPNRAVGNDFEGFGLVVLEAGINGVPVVAYDVDGISEALHDRQNGLLVKGSDAASFADAVLMLLNDDSLRMDLSRRSREYVKNNFDWENIVSRYTDQYKKLLMGGCAHAV